MKFLEIMRSMRTGLSFFFLEHIRLADPMLWIAFALLWAMMKIFCSLQQIVVMGAPIQEAIVLILLVVASAIRGRGGLDKSFADFIESMAAFLLVPAIFSPLSYVVTRSPMPPIDRPLEAIDLAMGFDAQYWHQLVSANKFLLWAHRISYLSLLPQCLVALLALPRLKGGKRGFTLLRSAALALLISYCITYLFPSIGPLPHTENWSADWIALRDSSKPFITSPSHIDGIVSFPSFHAAMAVLLFWSMRGFGRISWFFGTLNLLMIIATPIAGSHYLSDVFAGIFLGMVCIGITGYVAAWENRYRLPYYLAPETGS